MLTSKTACSMTRKLADVTEKDHFGGDGFYANKKIFATVWHEKQQANLKLSPALQVLFSGRAPNAIAPVENAWGRQGWTMFRLSLVDKSLFEEALRAAWVASAITKSSSGRNVAPKKSARKRPISKPQKSQK